MCEISIIIPVYNTKPKLLECCIQSVQEQTLQAIEIILVDDGSSREDTVTCCSRIALENPKVRLIRQSNRGQSAARKAGVEKAAGRYIMFIDSDDTIRPETCEYLLGLLVRSQADLAECMAYSSLEEQDDQKIRKIQENLIEGRDELMLQAVRTCDFPMGWSLWGKLFRTEIMQCCYIADDNIYYGEDLLCLIRYLKRSKRGIVSDKTLYYYNLKNENSVTKRVTAKKLTMCAFGREMAALYEDFSIPEGRERARAIYCDLLFGSYLLCAYQRFDNYHKICQEIRKEYKRYTSDLWNNPYITSRPRHIILRYCPALFFLIRGIKCLTGKTVATVE